MNFNYSFPIKINLPSIPFRSSSVVAKPQLKLIKDGFTSNPIYENLSTKEQLEAIIKSNPRIQEILKKHNSRKLC